MASLCNAEGDTVKLEKNRGKISLYEVVVTGSRAKSGTQLMSSSGNHIKFANFWEFETTAHNLRITGDPLVTL